MSSSLPLTFNEKYYENAAVFKGGHFFRRAMLCKKSRAFSNRAVFLNEIFKFKIRETNAGWRGTFQVGVTYDDPENFQSTATKKNDESTPRTIMNKVEECYYRPQNVLNFVIDRSGTMFLDVNGVGDWTVFLANIDVTRPVWLVFEVNGVIASLEIAGVPKVNSSITGSVNVTYESSDLKANEAEKEKLGKKVSNVEEGKEKEASPAVDKKENTASNEDAYLCVICFDRTKDAVITPCNHLCCCFNCAFDTWQRRGKCPICQTVIKDILKINVN